MNSFLICSQSEPTLRKKEWFSFCMRGKKEIRENPLFWWPALFKSRLLLSLRKTPCSTLMLTSISIARNWLGSAMPRFISNSTSKERKKKITGRSHIWCPFYAGSPSLFWSEWAASFMGMAPGTYCQLNWESEPGDLDHKLDLWHNVTWLYSPS